jgi:peptide-methionine (R)-S-oxide reductase
MLRPPSTALALLALLVTPAFAGTPVGHVTHTDAEWRQLLAPLPYAVLRHASTERAFTGKTWNEHRKGVYRCAGCGLELFRSDTKFESGTGWPSFWRPLDKTHVIERTDPGSPWGYTEVRCARCEGHLGHVFEDGPQPTGLRYCMNSAALEFVPGK